MKKRSKNHNPAKIEKAWKLRADGHTVERITATLRTPYWTLVDWFSFKTRVRLNMLAAAKSGWHARDSDAQKHCA